MLASRDGVLLDHNVTFLDWIAFTVYCLIVLVGSGVLVAVLAAPQLLLARKAHNDAIGDCDSQDAGNYSSDNSGHDESNVPVREEHQDNLLAITDSIGHRRPDGLYHHEGHETVPESEEP